jgi:membrane fusion protein (multidrug efflux system)
MKKSFGISIVALAVVGGVIWVYGPDIREAVAPSTSRSTTAAPRQGSAQAPIPVDIRSVTTGAVRQQIEAIGSLRSDESVVLRPEIAGRVSEILFDEGQPVKRGAPLLRLDAAIARAQVNQARANITLSRANFSRARELAERGAGTQRTLDEAQAKLSTDEAQLALAQATLDKSTLTAPFDGIVGLRQVSIGDYVNPGQTIANIESVEQLKVDFRIPEIYAQVIAAGQAIRVRLDAFPGATFEGSVYAIDPAIDPNGRAVILRARLPNADKKLRPGMFARVTLIVEERPNAVLIPETALMPMGRDVFAFRVIDGKAVQTKLRTGLRRGGDVEILEGLKAGDAIVAEGAQKLRDGQFVRESKLASGS